jgi:hypothetical protein
MALAIAQIRLLETRNQVTMPMTQLPGHHLVGFSALVSRQYMLFEQIGN